MQRGYYFVTQAVNESEAIAEADFCNELIKDTALDPDLPIFYDSEYSSDKTVRDGRADFITKEKRTKCAIAFCERIIEHGYKAGIYANTDWFKNQLNVALLLDYYLWVAQYSKECTAKHRVDIWQYSKTGQRSGLRGNVDLNKVYVDFNSTSNVVEKETGDRVFLATGTYVLKNNLNVRATPSINGRVLKRRELTVNAQEKSTQAGTLKAGTRVDISEFRQDSVYEWYVWAKIPSGWICFSFADADVTKKYLEKA